MDSGFTIRPRDSAARTAVGRSNTVRTDLSPSQSVNAAQQAAALHHAPAEAIAREPFIDPQCRSLLDREREERERRRKARNDEALARQRAYGGTAAASSPPVESPPLQADFEV